MKYYFIILSIILILFYYLIYNNKIEHMTKSECDSCNDKLTTNTLSTIVTQLKDQSKTNTDDIKKILLAISINNKKIRTLEESSEEMDQAFNLSDDDDDDD